MVEAGEAGTSVGVTATANLGWIFVGWFVNNSLINSGNSFNFSMPSQDTTLEARFEEEGPTPPTGFTLTIQPNNSNWGTVTNVSAGFGNSSPYEEGEEVILSATASSGSTFVRWEDDLGNPVSLNAFFTYEMPARNVVLTAVFDGPEEPEPGDPYPEEPNPVVNADFLPKLYENCSKFYLVKNFLWNPAHSSVFTESLFDGLEYIEIREPVGWDAVELELNRDRETYGFNHIASAQSLRFDCDSGKTFLKEAFIQEGVDADVKLVFVVKDFGDDRFIFQVVNTLNFTNYTKDRDVVTANLEDSEFNNLLETRKDTPYIYKRDLDVFLYSKALPQTTAYSRRTASLFEDTVLRPDDPDDILAAYGLFNSTTNPREIEGTFEYPEQLTYVQPAVESKYVMRPTLPGKYTIDIRLSMMAFVNISATLFPQFGGRIELTPRLYVEVVNSETGELWFQDVVDSTQVPGLSVYAPSLGQRGGEPDDEIMILLTNVTGHFWVQSYNFELSSTDDLYVYVEIINPEANTVNIWDPEANARVRQRIRLVQDWVQNGETFTPFPAEEPVLKIFGLTLARSSEAKLARLGDAMNEVLQKATLRTPERQVLVSDILAEGGGLHSLTIGNGFAIKNRAVPNQGTDTRASWFKLFKGAQALVNLGYNIEYDEDGLEVVRVELMDYFFADAEILTFGEDVEILEYEESVDVDYIYNELEFGYAKFSKERETEKAKTLQDTHGKLKFLTPIRKVKNELVQLSEFIASAFEIELVRRTQFDEDQDKDERNDNEVYMVNLRNQDELVGVVTGFRDFISTPNFFDFVIEPRQIRLIGRTIVPIIAGDEVELLYNDNSQGTFVVRDVVAAPQSLGSTNYDITIVFSTNIPSEPVGGQTTLAIVLPKERYIPESVEPFDNVVGLESPETHYNLRYTPKRMMKNWGKVINAGLSFKPGDQDVTFQEGEGNTELVTRLSVSDSFPFGDIQRVDIKEGADVTLSQIWGRTTNFLAYFVRFKVSLPFDVYNYIVRAHKNISPDENNYGYIQVPDGEGNLVRGYIVSCKYSPAMGTAEFKLWFARRIPILEADVFRPVFASNNKAFVDENGNYIQYN